MKLTTDGILMTVAEADIMRRALSVGIESRECDERSYEVLVKGSPQYGRLVDGEDDITDEVKTDLRDFRRTWRRLHAIIVRASKPQRRRAA